MGSVQTQDYEHWEHIVVDAGSSDGSRDYLESVYDSRRLLILEPDSGPADGLNKGFRRAKGDVLMYINADDALAPGALSRVAKFMSQNPEVDVMLADGWFVDASGTPTRHYKSDVFSPARSARGVGVFLQQGSAYRANALSSVPGPFRTSSRFVWDLQLMLDLYKVGARMGNLAADIGYFRRYTASISGSDALAARVEQERRQALIDALGPASFALLGSLEGPSRIIKRLKRFALGDKSLAEFPGWGGGINGDCR